MPKDQDLVELYNKIMPQMAEFEKIMHQRKCEQEQFKELIIKFDTDLGTKTSKITTKHL